LYLRVALAGIGAEHAVRAGGWHGLHGEEVWLMGLALTLVGAALATLRMARHRA
jgi:hypothetical protein